MAGRKASTGDWLIMIFIAAAIGGMGGGGMSCDNSTGSGDKNPAPKTSQVCNEYFKGGC